MLSKVFEFTEGPQNFEIIQQENDMADIKIRGKFIDDPNDDTEQILPFSFDKVIVRIINEEDGSFVSEMTSFTGTEEDCSALIKGVRVGGPYAVEIVYYDPINGYDYPVRGDKRRHFFVGDVFIIAGQSNAAGMGKGYIFEKSELGIHILRNLDYWDIASSPFNDLDYAKQSMFLSFAKKVKSETGRPIGFIPSAIGGASISRWLEGENGDLYKKMIDVIKIKNINARAILWYQGCAEAGNNTDIDEYIEKFKKFVSQIRRDLNNKHIKVFTFQLNRMMSNQYDRDLFEGYSKVREAQRLIPKKVEDVYVLPTQDASIMADFIHGGKASNVMLGERLALQVLEKEYKIGFGADAPEISKAILTDDKTVVLSFDNVYEFLYSYNAGNENLPITVDDKKGTVGICEYSVSKNEITVKTERKIELPAYVSGQCGNDTEKIIIDYATQIPILGFYKFEITKD